MCEGLIDLFPEISVYEKRFHCAFSGSYNTYYKKGETDIRCIKRIMRVFIIVLSLLAMNVSRCYCLSEQGFSSLIHTVEAMDKLMAYLNQRHSYVIDLIFGVLLARGQLHTLSKHLAMKSQKEQPILQSHLLEWMAVCDQIYYNSSIIVPPGGQQNITNGIFQGVLKPALWELDKNITRGLLGEPSGHWRMGDIYWQSKSRSWLRGIGHPIEEESDKCILELTKGKLSSKCLKMMTGSDRVTGYVLTHRLLYFQVARQLNCLQGTMLPYAEHKILNMCSNIFRETKNLYELGPPSGFRDLFIEQIVLCGIEGFAEFLRPEWLKIILTWQAPQGCFGEKSRARRRFKRSDYPLDEDCHMHITGLSAAVLSLFLRAILE